jgi:fructose-specific phosphotransferase system IIC component
MSAMLPALIVIGLFIALGLAAMRFGADSRDR